MTTDRPYPHDLEAERAILGACMTDRGCLDRVREAELEAEAFYRRDHALLFAALVKADAAGVPIDGPVALHDALDGQGWEQYGGQSYVHGLADRVVSTANVELSAKIVINKARLGRLLDATEQVREDALDGHADPDELAATLAAAAQAVPTTSKQGFRRMSTILGETIEQAEAAEKEPERHGGISCGFEGIDEKIGNLHPGDLIILAARPGMGKTALVLNFCEHVATTPWPDGDKATPPPKPGQPPPRKATRNVAVFSLEMPEDQLARRTLSGMGDGKVSAKDLRTGAAHFMSIKRLRQAHEADPDRLASLYVDDQGGLTASQVAARARRLKQRVGELALVVVDFLQILKAEPHLMRAKLNEKVAFMSKSLKQMGKDLGCCVIALAQLNRKVEERADKTPLLSDLGDSGATEQVADVVLFVYRPEYYEPNNPELRGKASAIVAKARNGEIGSVPLHFEGRTTTFSDALEQPAEDRSEGWGAKAP